MPRLLGRDDLEVADARPAARAPVDEGLGPIGEVGLVKAGEGDSDGTRRALVHCEAKTAPVERRPDPPLLSEHDLAGLVDELPHPLEVALATERLPRLAIPGDDLVEDVLGGDRGVVEAGQPEGRPARHAGVADHEVLDRRGQGVAEVERTGDVGRRLDDDEGLLRLVGSRACPVGREDVGRQPALVDRAFEVGRDVGRRELPIGHRVVLLR